MKLMRTSPDYALVKREARSLLNRYGLEDPPVDPVVLARQEGVDIKFVRFTGDYVNVAGFYDPTERSIYVNKEEYPLRQTFTVGHELGHAKLHEQWAKSDQYKVFWRDPSRNSDDFHEKEANAFAAHLLVPRFMLDKYYRWVSEEGLSQLFAVSVPTIRNRLSFEYGI